MRSADRIKILVCSSSFYPPKGGGVISLREICSGLAKRGFDISTTYIGTEKDPGSRSYPRRISTTMRGMWPRIWELRGRWRRVVSELVALEEPDIVITQQADAGPTVEVCKRNSIPVVILLQGIDVFCLGSFWSGTPWKCQYRCVGCKDGGGRLWQYPFFMSQIGSLRDAFVKADAVVSNSSFTAETLRLILGVDSTVATPIMEEPKLVRGKKPGTKILFFSPVAHKGVDIAIELAGLMKDEQFIFAGGSANKRTVRRMKMAGNIEYLPWIGDVNSLYGQTKVLIMPSLIPEGFGRGCVEAMRRGIPCVVSNIGALPETLGRGGDVVLEYRDAEEWARTIRSYSDPAYLASKSRSALLESERYSHVTAVDQMAELIETLVGRKQGDSHGVA